MEKKIFRSICMVAFGVLIINTIVFLHMIYTYYIDSNMISQLCAFV